jgi:phenylpropionate dioxygenase-like ring-hydroxylating dioxygenase large terminal subunit
VAVQPIVGQDDPISNADIGGGACMTETYLRDAWYVAAWAGDLDRRPLRRIFLDEPILLYRKENGDPVALQDRCPHRFVPLSLGTLRGDEIECAYHGLRFDGSGACTLNPHGDHAIPDSLRVRSYPLVERHGLVWIWMGQPARSATGAIPDFSIVGDASRYAAASGYTHVKANYQLITDNLLDLSHVEFLHPSLRTEGGHAPRLELNQQGDTVWSMRYRDNVPPNQLLKMFWSDGLGDSRAHMRWDPPSLLMLDVGITGVGRPVEEGVAVPSAHLLTPETATTTHYHWAFLRNVRIHDEALTQTIKALGNQAFDKEDKPIIEWQQANMGTTDLAALRPVLLQPDAPAARARRVLAQRIAQEQAAGVPA